MRHKPSGTGHRLVYVTCVPAGLLQVGMPLGQQERDSDGESESTWPEDDNISEDITLEPITAEMDYDTGREQDINGNFDTG